MKNIKRKFGYTVLFSLVVLGAFVAQEIVSVYSEASGPPSLVEKSQHRKPEVKSSMRTQTKRISLPKNRTVIIEGQIGEETLLAAEQIAKLGKTPEPIYIVINSPGGSVFAGATVIEAIEAAKGPVNTICVQMCASMAAFIFEHGDERMMFSRSMLMFHPASAGLQGELDKMVSYLTAVQNFVRRIEKYVADRVGISLAQYKAMAAKELWLDSDAAIRGRFADKIVFADLPE